MDRQDSTCAEQLAALEERVEERTTELERANQDLRASQELLASLLECLPAFVYLLGRDHRIRYANQRFIEIFGEFEGRSCYEVTAKRDRPCEPCPSFQVFEKVGPLEWEWSDPSSGRVYQILSYPMPSVDDVPIVLELGVEISERKRFDQEKQQLIHDLNERVKELRCVYGATEAMRRHDSLDAAFREIVELIPSGWRFPDATRARIVFDGIEHLSCAFEPTAWSLTAPIVVRGRPRGAVEVYCLDASAPGDADVFLTEERRLVEGIATSIGAWLERWLAEDRLQAILDNVTDGVVLADLETGCLDTWNPAFCKIFGYSNDEAGLLGWGDLVPVETVEVAARTIGDLVSRWQPLNVEASLRRKDGSTFVADVGATPVELAGRQYLLGAIRDVTARRDLERQLQTAQRLESLGRLAGGIAHDFNNVLEVIQGFGELALDAIGEGVQARSDVQQILDAANRARRLTRQLLTFSRRQTIQPAVLDLNAVILGLDRILRRTLGDDVELTMALEPELWSIRADVGHVEQVVINLALNARDAMPAGGRLTVETSNVTLDEDSDRGLVNSTTSDHVRLAVTDTGEGIDPKNRDRIFEPFFTTKPEGKGTGIGLAVVYGVIQQSSGTIRFTSELGEGTTFEVFLPRVREVSKSQVVAPPRAVDVSGHETVLLVEDDDMVRKALSRMLGTAGYTILPARNGEAALAIVAEGGREIDVLITDVMMPQMNGEELAERLVAQLPGLAVLFISGYTDDVFSDRGMTLKGAELLEKPFSREQLLTKLKELLDRNAARAR